MSNVGPCALLFALLSGPLPALGMTPARYAVDVHFDPNSVALSAGDIERILLPVKTGCGGSVALYLVVGHADSSESGDKQLLSAARAAAVVIHVLQTHPVLGPVTWIEGKSDKQPAAFHKTVEHRAKNRRAEIEVVCEISKR